MTTVLTLALYPWQLCTALTARLVAWLLFGPAR